MRKTTLILLGTLLVLPLSVQALADGQCPNEPLYGLAYGPFREEQSPGGLEPNIAEIHQDLQIIAGKAHAIRTYGVDGILAEIPRLCQEYDIDCYVGCHIDGDPCQDADTIERLLLIADANYVTTKGLLVGNEYLTAHESDPCSPSYLIGLIEYVKSRTNLPVSTGEDWLRWHLEPSLVPAVDFIASNHYAFHRGIGIELAAYENVLNYNSMKAAYPDKEVILFETGWPTDGASIGAAVPSEENQARFLREFLPLAKTHNIKYFIFEAFDEPWKYRPDAPYESHLGCYNVSRSPKVGISSICAASMADVNFDGTVNLVDYAALAADWLDIRDKDDLCYPADLNHNCIVDQQDLSLMASYWLESE